MGKESKVFQPLSEVERSDFLAKVNSLITVIEKFKESYALLKVSLEFSEKHNEALQSQVIRLQYIIFILIAEIRSLCEEVSKQSDYAKRHNKMSYGKPEK